MSKSKKHYNQHEIGERLRSIRKRKKLTQVELSKRLGIVQSDLSKMERGHYRLGLETLLKLMRETGVSFYEFFDELPVQDPELLQPREAELLDAFKDLDFKMQEEVRSFIAFKKHEKANPR